MKKTIQAQINLLIQGISNNKNCFETSFINEVKEKIETIKRDESYNIDTFNSLKPYLITVITSI